MKKLWGPAFPCEQITETTVEYCETTEQNEFSYRTRPHEGMDLLDYFAARAPVEIPDWFEGPKVPDPVQPSIPREIDDPNTESWLRGLAFDLWGAYQQEDPRRQIAIAFERDVYRWRRQKEATRKLRAGKRFFAWRYAYAEGMLAARYETDPRSERILKEIEAWGGANGYPALRGDIEAALEEELTG